MRTYYKFPESISIVAAKMKLSILSLLVMLFVLSGKYGVMAIFRIYEFTDNFPAVEGETGSHKKCTNPKVGKPGRF